MNKNFLMILALVFGLSFNVFAEAEKELDINTALRLMKSAVIDQESPDSKIVINNSEYDIQLWKDGPRKGLYASTALFRDSGFAGIFVGIFGQTAKGPRLLASFTDLEPDGIDPPWNSMIGLDLTPYRISDQERAFGVEYHNSYQSTARGSASTALYLFRYAKGALTLIFQIRTQEGSNDPYGKYSEYHDRKIIMGKTKHKEFYDLMIKESETKRITRYRWNGERYVKG